MLVDGTNLVNTMHKRPVNKDLNHASEEATNFLAELIRDGVHIRGVCHVVFPGGKSPALRLHYLSVMA